MKFIWSVVLLASIVCSVGVPMFFGHGLALHESKWFGYAAVLLVIAAVLFFVQRSAHTERDTVHH